MPWVNLQMISLGSLLIFNVHAAAGSARCIDAETLRRREDRLLRTFQTLNVSMESARSAGTCAQAAEETHEDPSGRSLSPWKYILNRRDDRFPREIAFAKCLCEGCLINQQEDLSYNSVEVFVRLMVLRKTPCPHDPGKYMVRRDSLKVSVACTCVKPMYYE